MRTCFLTNTRQRQRLWRTRVTHPPHSTDNKSWSPIRVRIVNTFFFSVTLCCVVCFTWRVWRCVMCDTRCVVQRDVMFVSLAWVSRYAEQSGPLLIFFFSVLELGEKSWLFFSLNDVIIITKCNRTLRADNISMISCVYYRYCWRPFYWPKNGVIVHIPAN